MRVSLIYLEFYVTLSTYVSVTLGELEGQMKPVYTVGQVLYYKLQTNSKEIPAFPLETGQRFKLQSQRWQASVTIASPLYV